MAIQQLPLFDQVIGKQRDSRAYREESNSMPDTYKGIYAMHKYWSKKPHNLIANYIERFSQPGDFVIDSFCGSGITTIESTRLGRRAIGIDINPLLNFWANLLWKLSRNNTKSSLIFKTENVFDTDYRKADYLYIFLMPKLIAELTPKLNEELKKGAIVISHGFPILTWKRKLYKTLSRKPFPTYYYKI